MSSTDSDDDCYGNAAKRLQSLKKTYVPEKFDDISVEEPTKSDYDKVSKHLAPSSIALDDSNTSLNSNNVDEEELTLEAIIANNTKPKRGRKRKVVDNFEPINERVTRSRRKTATSHQATSSIEVNKDLSQSNCPETSNKSRRGRNRYTGDNLDTTTRGRGSNNNRTSRATRNSRRGRNSTNRGTWSNAIEEIAYPTYSIGDFGEYPDTCGNQALFASKETNEVEVIEEDDPLENENEELSVKVYWQSTQVFRFKIRRYQKLTQIFKYFTEKENIDSNKLILMYKDKIIKTEDTPDTINYNIAEFIDGGVVNSDVTGLVNVNSKELNQRDSNNGFKIKFQCQMLKKPFEMTVKEDDRLAGAMTLCAEHLELPMEKLKFYFDGDLISGKKTPQELSLENGDCIDVKIVS